VHGAPLHATGIGSLIGLHLRGRREIAPAAETLFHLEMLERGYYFARRGYIALSLPTTEADCDGFASAVDEFWAARGPAIGAALSPA
jgi:glutamate-1-semialdehyde 2,1-aminomutase